MYSGGVRRLLGPRYYRDYGGFGGNLIEPSWGRPLGGPVYGMDRSYMYDRPCREPYRDRPYYSKASSNSLSGVIREIEDEMYKQDDSARKTCQDGEKLADYRYQALSDLLADAYDIFDRVSEDMSRVEPEELIRIISKFKSRINYVRTGKLNDLDPAKRRDIIRL